MRTPSYLVAEIGINHNGSLDVAKKLIDEVKRAGWDCVKFQKRTPEICVPSSMRDVQRDTPWGVMSYLDYRKRIEFGQDEYEQINGYCKKIGIAWTASVWDTISVEFLSQFDIPFIKIPSALISRTDILHAVKRQARPVMWSTGMHDAEQIKKVAQIYPGSTMLHTVSVYPAPHENLNLRLIRTLKEQYPSHRVGYSGHELGIAMSLVAWALGADVIERHVTLDRSMWGTDQSASLEPGGFSRLARDIRSASLALGDGIKKILDDELVKLKQLSAS